MSIDINYNIESNNKEYYNNVTKQYAKFFIDNYYTPTLTSNQLSNWTSITFNENNGYMIGIGDASDTLNHNLIFSSNGGITWSSQLISTNESNNTKWNDITFDGISTYVAVGNANSISNRAYIINFNESLSSINYITNGNNGTQNNNWTSVIYAAGFFTAVSSNGTKRLMTSTNGTNWTGYTITSRSWNRIAYGKGIFIIASTDGNIKLMYSLDNTITWIDCIFTDIYSNPISNISIIFCSKINKFLFSFYYPTDSKSYIYSSTDGITWTKTYEISDTTAIIKSLVWSQSLELIIASCYSSSDFNLIFSRDSINWMLEKTIFTFLSNINSKIIWNRIFSNFIIITDKKSSGAIITTKNFGINNLLDRKNYYINYNYINSIYYSNNDVKVPSIEYFYIYPILTINNENITYSVSPNLPSGVNLNTYNGVISGGYNQMINFPRTEYTITATDLYEDQKLITKIYLEFISDIYSITTFYYNQNNFLNIFVNLTTSSFYNPTIIGSPKITYQFFSNPNLDIFSVNETTGVLKIKPITSGIYNLTLRATNSKGDFDNSLIVNIINRPPTSFSYNNSQSVTLIVSGSSASYSPSVNDGTELTYSVISNNLNLLPGSSINTNTGVLTIVPSSNPQNVQLNISATNTSGQSTTSFTIIIKNPEIVNFGYTPSSLNDITYNGSKNFNLLSNFIGQNVSYSVSSGFSLPAGLSLNSNTGIISGNNITSPFSGRTRIIAESFGVESKTADIIFSIRVNISTITVGNVFINRSQNIGGLIFNWIDTNIGYSSISTEFGDPFGSITSTKFNNTIILGIYTTVTGLNSVSTTRIIISGNILSNPNWTLMTVSGNNGISKNFNRTLISSQFINGNTHFIFDGKLSDAWTTTDATLNLNGVTSLSIVIE